MWNKKISGDRLNSESDARYTRGWVGPIIPKNSAY